jgi:DNA primase
MLDGAANDIEFCLLAEREKCDLTTPGGKLEFLRAAAAVLATRESPLERDIYAAKLAEELDVGKDAIVAQTEALRRRQAKRQEREKLWSLQKESALLGDRLNPQAAVWLRAAKAEERLLAIVLNSPALFKTVWERLAQEELVTPFHQKLWALLCERFLQGQEVSLALLGPRLTNEEMGRLQKLFLAGAALPHGQGEVEDCIKVILEEKNKERQKTVRPAELSDEAFLRLFRPPPCQDGSPKA